MPPPLASLRILKRVLAKLSYLQGWSCTAAAILLRGSIPIQLLIGGVFCLLLPIGLLLTHPILAVVLFLGAVKVALDLLSVAFQNPELEAVPSVDVTSEQRELHRYLQRLWILSRTGTISIVDGTAVRVKKNADLEIGWLLLGCVTWEQLGALVAHEYARYEMGGAVLDYVLEKARAHAFRSVEETETFISRILADAVQMIVAEMAGILRHAQNCAADRRVHQSAILHLGEALRVSSGLSDFEMPFWEQVHSLGFGNNRPSLIRCFHVFVLQERTTPVRVDRRIQKRIAALPQPTASEDEIRPRLTDYLDDFVSEYQLLVHLRSARRIANAAERRPLCKAGHRICWMTTVAEHAKKLEGLTVADLAHEVQDLADCGRADEPRGRYDLGLYVAASAASHALVGAGWRLHIPRGGPVILDGPGGETLAPWSFLFAIQLGDLKAESWISTCDRLGIGHLSLSR